MPKYIITVDYGYGEEHEEHDCKDQSEADDVSYQVWKEGAESQGVYLAERWTDEKAYDVGLIDEDPSEEEE